MKNCNLHLENYVVYWSGCNLVLYSWSIHSKNVRSRSPQRSANGRKRPIHSVMNHENFLLNANPLVAFFQKSPREFTKADIMRYIAEHGIRMVNFLYPAGDGRLKTLNFVITDRAISTPSSATASA